MKMKSLYLFTSEFPYGKMENFLEIELPYLCERFPKVVIVPISGAGKTMRPVPANCEVMEPIRHGKKDALLHGFSIRRFPVFFKEFLGMSVWKKKSRLRSFVFAVINANNYLHNPRFKDVLRNVQPDDVFYSYWGKVGTDLWPFVKGKAKLVSRFHGDWDLWGICEDYAPFRVQAARALDMAAFISDIGKDYFMDKWNTRNPQVFPLGTVNMGVTSQRSTDGVIRVVSCSTIYSVKRVDLIYRALQMIDDRKVEWTHIGGGRAIDNGVVVNELKEMVSISRSNVKVNLLGPMPNADVLRYYEEHPVDVFVNVSSVEGVPVSIMEALSYNIPAVGTDVGATREVVTKQSGVLVSANPSEFEVKEAIIKAVDSKGLRPRDHWYERYNANNNYKRWAAALYEL